MTQQLPAEFTRRLAEISAAGEHAKRSGGPWRLYIPRPGSSRLWLHWSFATETEAKARVAGMYPAIRKRAQIRHEA